MNIFVGRKKEIAQLKSLLQKRTASLVVVKGRRRIGKSRLIEEFGRTLRMYSFAGLPPTDKTTAQDQRDHFGWQLGQVLLQPTFKEEDWNDLFLRLAAHTRVGRVLILLDEISWMGSKDANFLGKLKNAWDLEFKKNAELILVLCGSVSSWIEKNILNSTGFLGRIDLILTLNELSLHDCNKIWGASSEQWSAYEKFKALSVTGGVPRYLEILSPQLSAEENIKRLCFIQEGFLFNEFEQIFHDLFARRSDTYKEILSCLGEKPHASLDDLFK